MNLAADEPVAIMISQSRVTAAADETFAIMITNVPLNAHPMLSSESRSIASLKRARLRLQSRCLAPVQHHLLPATCYLLPVYTYTWYTTLLSVASIPATYYSLFALFLVTTKSSDRGTSINEY